MGKTKRTFPGFRYRECDSFAEYLREQSLKGWHFKEWRLGLVFEKGEPKDITYAVEIFPKGTEMTVRPEEDTEEYAEYCNAAGWKLLDANRRFCIFKREKEDAVLIVEEKERFGNIKKAEWRAWLNVSVSMIALAVLQALSFWFMNFTHQIFNEFLLCLTVIIVTAGICCVGEAGGLLWWAHDKKKRLSAGKSVFYGTKKLRLISWRSVFCLITFFVFGYIGMKHTPLLGICIAAMIVLMLVTSAGVAFFRPSAADNQLLQMGAVALLMIVSVVGITAVLLPTNQKETMGVRQTDTAPLMKEDYREVTGKAAVFGECTDSMFGYAFRFEIDYGDEAEENFLKYEVYHSPYSWIGDKVWKEKARNRQGAEECSALWDAEAAYRYGMENGTSFIYEIKYPEDVLILWISGENMLTKEEISVIRRELQL